MPSVPRSEFFTLPSPSESVDEDAHVMLELALEQARGWMKQDGQVPMTLLAATPNGLLMLVGGKMETEEEKDHFATQARLFLVAQRATACALVMEVWLAMARDGNLPKGPPSKHPERTEAVSIAVETRQQKLWQLLPIRRDAGNRFIGFALSLVPEGAEMAGRFSELLPPIFPTVETARYAQMVAEAAGVRAADAGAAPAR